jgi:hypothetical protein
MQIDFDSLSDKFIDIDKKLESVKLEDCLEYCTPNVFISDTLIKHEDLNKKKSGQYAKYKTIPKWHHYAWDMIK